MVVIFSNSVYLLCLAPFPRDRKSLCGESSDTSFHHVIGLNNIYSQKNTYVNTTQMVQDLTVSAALIYKSSPAIL